MPKRFLIDADATLDYVFDWTTWLNGDTISSYTITASGITVDSDSNTDTAVTVWLSGASEGATVKCDVVTAAGRSDDRTMVFSLIQR